MGIIKNENEKIRVITQLIKDDESRRVLEERMDMSIYDDIEKLNRRMSENNTLEVGGYKLTVLDVTCRINTTANYKYVIRTTYICNDKTWNLVKEALDGPYSLIGYEVLENDEKMLVFGY